MKTLIVLNEVIAGVPDVVSALFAALLWVFLFLFLFEMRGIFKKKKTAIDRLSTSIDVVNSRLSSMENFLAEAARDHNTMLRSALTVQQHIEEYIRKESFYDYDKRGVRAFVIYSITSGRFKIECYRKKTKEESRGENDWEMIRCGWIPSYNNRVEAERRALEYAEAICKEHNY